MNIFPVHRNNLLPRGKQIGKYIHIRHSYYGEQMLDVWKHFFGPWYYWEETKKLDLPNSEEVG